MVRSFDRFSARYMRAPGTGDPPGIGTNASGVCLSFLENGIVSSQKPVRAIRGRASAFGSNLVICTVRTTIRAVPVGEPICSNAVTWNRLSDFRHGHKPWRRS